MRRVSSLVVLAAVAALLLPATAAAGSHDGPLVIVYGDVHVEEGEGFDGIYVARGDLRLDGGSSSDVVVFSGHVTVAGRIEGDLVILDGQANLLPDSYVSGDVRYGDERPLVAGEAIVRGDVTKGDWGDSLDFLPLLGTFVLWLGISISMAILGALLLLIAPRAADALYERARGRIGPVVAIGFAVAICLPVAGAIAAVTLVGIPLSFVILLALLPLAAIAYVVAAWALGRRLVEPPVSPIWAFLLGLAILRAAALVPILGFLVGLAAVVFGLGLIGAAIGAARERPAAPAPARSPGS